MNSLEDLIDFELNEYNNIKKETYNIINHIFIYNQKTNNRYKKELQKMIDNLQSNLLIIKYLEDEITSINNTSQLH
jgi:hypothetical protein